MATNKTVFLNKAIEAVTQMAALQEWLSGLAGVYTARGYGTTDPITSADLPTNEIPLTAAEFNATVVPLVIDYLSFATEPRCSRKTARRTWIRREGIFEAMIYGQDWGGYLSALNEDAIPYNDLHAAGLLDFFVTKGDQEVPYISSTKNIAYARAAGVEVIGCFYWHYPLWTPEYQVAEYSRAIEREKPDFICLDMEDAQGQSSVTISNNARQVCAGLARNFPGKRIFIYTSRDYINTMTPDANAWIGEYRRWIASWPDGHVQRTEAQRYLSFDEIKGYPLPTWTPKLPFGWVGWDIWQHVTWPRPEGYGWPFNHNYDWDVFNGSLDDLKVLIGMKLPPEYTDAEKLAKLWNAHPELHR